MDLWLKYHIYARILAKGLTKTIPLSQTDVVNNNTYSQVYSGNHCGKGERQQEALMSRFAVDEKAWVAKCDAEYRVAN